jgi:VanZ family protein
MPIQQHLDRIAYAAAVLFLPALSGVIGGELTLAGDGIDVWDKAKHFTAYFILSFLATAALKAHRSALAAMLGLVAMGGALELIQGAIGRDCDIHDEIANTLGVLAGGLLAWIVIGLVARARRA